MKLTSGMLQHVREEFNSIVNLTKKCTLLFNNRLTTVTHERENKTQKTSAFLPDQEL